MEMMKFPLMAVAEFKARTAFHGALTRPKGRIKSQFDHRPAAGSRHGSVLEVLERFPVGLWHNFVC